MASRNKDITLTALDLFKTRIALVQAFLHAHGYDGVLLSRVDNFAMATGGRRNYVGIMSDVGACSLFVSRDGTAYFVGNNIEETRVMAEELDTLGCAVRTFLWFDDTVATVVAREFSGVLVSDDGSVGANVNHELGYLRALLTPAEMEKYRALGQRAAEAMTATIEAVEPGMAEADIAATLIAEGAKRRCLVPVALIAADDRIARFRHPLPTTARLLDDGSAERGVANYVMVVGGFWCEGLVVSITRFKQVGDVAPETLGAYDRICGVDAVLQEETQAGRTMGELFSVCQRAYVDLGFPENEWHNHHQGGTTGYAARTCKAAPDESFPILDPVWSQRVKMVTGIDVEFGHAFAWNPSAVGVKSEDTFLLTAEGGREIVTRTPAFPEVDLRRVLGRDTDVVKSGIMMG